jgi:hypothetical protein
LVVRALDDLLMCFTVCRVCEKLDHLVSELEQPELEIGDVELECHGDTESRFPFGRECCHYSMGLSHFRGVSKQPTHHQERTESLRN